MKTFRQFVEDMNPGMQSMFASRPSTRRDSMPESRPQQHLLRLSYAVFNVFQRYWEGQSDPLYAILSRRGDSVDWVNIAATEEEIERLKEVAQEILTKSDDRGEIATAKQLLSTLP